jgi:hypothetical protein
MKFVRKARSPAEQNAVISEEDGLLYFTTTREIPPKTELQVGYGYDYAQKYGFTSMVVCEDVNVTESSPSSPPQTTKKAKKNSGGNKVQKFLCFECETCCESSEELQQHLEAVHGDTDLFRRPKKNAMKKFYNSLKNPPPDRTDVEASEKVKKQAAESTTFISKRLMKKEIERIKEQEEMAIVESSSPDTDDKCEQPSSAAQSTTPKVKCTICYKPFATKERLEKHMMVHQSSDTKPLKCQFCAKRFLTNSALAGHVKTHSGKNGEPRTETRS